jgi:hypothetical protein
VTDSSIRGPINITTTNTIYTAPAGTILIGVTFAPLTNTNTPTLIPPPILTAQTFVVTNNYSSFTVTNTPDDPLWRSSITGITVNGSPLSVSAYDTTQPGKIVFNPALDPLLQTPGAKLLAFTATGYSTNSITQIIAGVPAQLGITTQPKAPLADGGALATQPVVAVQDALGNTVSSSASIVAAPSAATWTLSGNTNKAAVNGTTTFTGLTAFSTAAVAGAKIAFTSAGLTGVTSAAFNIPAPILSKLSGAALSGGKFKVSFTNATALGFSVLATNDISAPITNWPVVGPAIESPAGSGNYQYTNSTATNSLFYLIRQP